MAFTLTTKLGIKKPTPGTGELVNLADVNAGWDKADAAAGNTICTSSTRPASPFQGQQIHETDTGNGYVRSGSAWVLIYRSAVGSEQVAVATTDTTRTNSTTLLDAAGLVVPVVANARYLIEAALWYTTNATADIKWGWTGPSGAGMQWSSWGPDPAAASQVAAVDTGMLPIGNTLATAGSAVDGSARPMGLLTVGATAGNLQLRFAQQVANAVNTIVRTGSVLRATRVA